jgi:hypothetical protein
MLEYCAVSIFADLVVKSESLVEWSSHNLSYFQNSLDFFADLKSSLIVLNQVGGGHLISRFIRYPDRVTKKNHQNHLQNCPIPSPFAACLLTPFPGTLAHPKKFAYVHHRSPVLMIRLWE